MNNTTMLDAMRTAGLVGIKTFHLPTMDRRQKLEAIMDPSNWRRFVRRSGPRDVFQIVAGQVTYRVTCVTERRFLLHLLEGEVLKYMGTSELGKAGLSIDRKIPAFQPLESQIVEELCKLLLEVWSVEDEGDDLEDGHSRVIVHGRRAHWRRLTGRNGYNAHSCPPPEIVAMGVPKEKTGYTFVHEVAPVAA